MGTVTAQSIITKARYILHDTDAANYRWTDPELLAWLNAGQQQIVILKPDAYAQAENILLDSGTRQELPAGAVGLIDIPLNMGTDGATPGNAIRRTDRRILDNQVPGWHATTPGASIELFMYDPREPQAFYVYPPAAALTYVKIVYSKNPADVADVADPITLDDIYASSLLDYILYRAYSKDADYMDASNRSVAAYTVFLQGLGRQDMVEAVNDPNLPEEQRRQAGIAMAGK